MVGGDSYPEHAVQIGIHLADSGRGWLVFLFKKSNLRRLLNRFCEPLCGTLGSLDAFNGPFDAFNGPNGPLLKLSANLLGLCCLLQYLSMSDLYVSGVGVNVNVRSLCVTVVTPDSVVPESGVNFNVWSQCQCQCQGRLN